MDYTQGRLDLAPIIQPHRHPFPMPMQFGRAWRDDFHSYPNLGDGAPHWTVVNGTWRVRNQLYCQNDITLVFVSVANTPTQWSNIILKARFNRLAGDQHRFLTRYNTYNEMLTIAVFAGSLELIARVGGGWIPLASVAYTFNNNVWYEIEIWLNTNNVQVYINDVRTINWTGVLAASIQTGQIGLMTGSSHVHFDDIDVRVL